MLLQRALLLSAGIYTGLASSSYTPIAIATSTFLSCSYKSGSESGGVAPTPIPTVIASTHTTSTSQFHNTTVPSTITVADSTTVTVTQVTKTLYAASEATVTIPTSTVGVGTVFTVATAVFTKTVCENGVKPVTVTEYTGTYTPLSGQAPTLPATYPTEAICTMTLLYSTDLFPTITSGVVTTTVAPSTTVATPTTTTTTSTVVFGTSTTYLTSVTVTYSDYTPVASATTTTVSCGETVTRTLAARCAPSNLISAINGNGLLSGTYANRTSVVYTTEEPWGSDPSLCCQACIDNKGCGASEGSSPACGLHYLATEDGEPVCDAEIFSLTLSADVIPGQGLVAQSGCDRVDYVVPKA